MVATFEVAGLKLRCEEIEVAAGKPHSSVSAIHKVCARAEHDRYAASLLGRFRYFFFISHSTIALTSTKGTRVADWERPFGAAVKRLEQQIPELLRR